MILKEAQATTSKSVNVKITVLQSFSRERSCSLVFNPLKFPGLHQVNVFQRSWLPSRVKFMKGNNTSWLCRQDAIAANTPWHAGQLRWPSTPRRCQQPQRPQPRSLAQGGQTPRRPVPQKPSALRVVDHCRSAHTQLQTAKYHQEDKSDH